MLPALRKADVRLCRARAPRAWALLRVHEEGTREDEDRAAAPGPAAHEDSARGRDVPGVPSDVRPGTRRQRSHLRGATGRAGGGKKTTLGAVLQAEVIAEIDTLVGTDAVDGWDFEAIETAARRQAMWLAARAVERRINADTSDHAGPTVPCGCGRPARYAGRHDKTVKSVLGPLTLSRAYYHCAMCETGFCPRDRALGVQCGSLTPGVLRMVGQVGAMVSFEEGHELLTALAGVDVPTKHVERTAEVLGREIAQDERCVRGPSSRCGRGVDAVLGDGWHGCAGAQRGGGGPRGQTARRLGQDARGQARHGVERGEAGRSRTARARRGVDQLLGGNRERCLTRHRRASCRVNTTSKLVA